MLIGIDGNEANVEKKVGIGEYAFELLLQFKEIANRKSQIANKLDDIQFQIYLKDQPRPEMPKENENWKYVVVGPKKLWTQIGLPLYLFTHFPRPNVFFSPSHYAPRFAPCPTAISIMDVSYSHYPSLFAKKDLYQLKEWTKYSAQNAAHIFTISSSSKDDILKLYGKHASQVSVTYPGIKPELENMNTDLSKKELEEKFGINENYILFVGTLQPRKNIERLIEAFSRIVRGPAAHHPVPMASTSVQSRHSNGVPTRVTPSQLQLVIVGKRGWLYEDILAAPKKFGVEKEVKFLEFVQNEDLPSLYKRAVFFILPSLYEGFGLPVVEAMRYGTPVITSKVSSLPEAGGDAALYVDPESVEDIAEKMEKLLLDGKLKEKMIKKGYEHIKRFSWEKAARETLDVLTDLAK